MLSSFSYTYRGDGNIASERDHNNVTTTYTYDLLGRLISEVGGCSRYYSYDAAGNRTQVIVDTATTISYTYDSDGRLISETSNDGSNLLTTSYVYDSNGSLISENDGSTTTYSYDVWGNMTSAGGATYAYNAQGLRISKTINGTTDSFVLVGGDVWADSESTYLRGLELISSDDYFYLYNIRGDVIQLLDYNGEVVKTYDYDAYGNELNRDLSDENPFRYCGEYYDVETGLIYLRARYYDPSVGRFTSVDPAKDGLNWYAYCNADPLNYLDPSGLAFNSLGGDLGMGRGPISSKTFTHYGASNLSYILSQMKAGRDIHKLIEDDIISKQGKLKNVFYPEQTINQTNGRIGRVDIMSYYGEAYEIKRNNIFQVMLAYAQVGRYMKGSWTNPETEKVHIVMPGDYIPSGSVTYDGQAVNYRFIDYGIIVYDYHPSKENLTVPITVHAQDKVKEKENNPAQEKVQHPLPALKPTPAYSSPNTNSIIALSCGVAAVGIGVWLLKNITTIYR